MPPDGEVTRGEFDMLRQQVSDNGARLNSIDTSGTRGVGVLQLQITEIQKDIQSVKAHVSKHDDDHVAEAAERTRIRRSSWRWGISTVIAFLLMIEAPLLYLVSSARR